MRHRSRRTLVATLAVVAAGVAVPAHMPSSAAAAPGFCSFDGQPGLTTFRWDGSADDGQWGTPANWEGNDVPGNLDAATGYVCIDAAADQDAGSDTVELPDGVEARVQAFDIRGGTTLLISEGGKLFGYGNHTTRPSYLRAGSTTRLVAGTFGGPGRIELLGQMTWRSLAPPAAASIVSDPACALSASCVPATVAGKLVVGDFSTLRVDGRGVNLEDRYTLVVRGRLLLTGPRAFVAADRRTSIQLRPRTGPGAGVLDIANGGSIFEGRPMGYGEGQLATFVNQGLVLKRGAGVSAINARYSVQGSGANRGRVEVRAGTLVLPDGAVAPARVAKGKSYGTGTCLEASSCLTRTTGDDRQFGRFQVPTSDGNGAVVTVRELGAKHQPGDVETPIQFHAAGLRAGSVAVLTLRYDNAALLARTKNTLKIFRIPNGSQQRMLVPNCRAGGAFPAGKKSCVAQRSDVGGGDVQVKIRTLVTSRWVGR